MTKLLLALVLPALINLPTVSAQQPAERPVVDDQSKATSVNNQAAGTSQPQSFKIPADIHLSLTVEDLPGIANPQSFWEGFYEIRVADWSAVVDKTKSGGDTLELGDVLLRLSSPRHSFLAKEDRCLRLSIPITGPLLERLRQQAQKPQAFLLRSTVRLFDAKLDQNFAVKLNRIWQLKLFPDGDASIAIRIEPDGSYDISGPNPKELPAGYTTVGLAPDKIPPTRKP